jgi:hypothetical protein
MNEITKTIYELEISLLSSEVRSSAEALDKLLTDDFIEFGSSGIIYTKKEILEILPNTLEKVEYIVSDFTTQVLANDVVFATFKTDRTINGAEKLTSWRSSLWKKSDKGWQMFFHQGTPINKHL